MIELIQDWISNWDADWAPRPRDSIGGNAGSMLVSGKSRPERAIQ